MHLECLYCFTINRNIYVPVCDAYMLVNDPSLKGNREIWITTTTIMSYRLKRDNNLPRQKRSTNAENVLVMQGGGSLGAFGCGLFKALVKRT